MCCQHLRPFRPKLGICITLTESRCTSSLGQAVPIGYSRCHPFFVCIFYDGIALFQFSWECSTSFIMSFVVKPEMDYIIRTGVRSSELSPTDQPTTIGCPRWHLLPSASFSDDETMDPAIPKVSCVPSLRVLSCWGIWIVLVLMLSHKLLWWHKVWRSRRRNMDIP